MAQYKTKLNPFTGQLQLVPTNIVLSFKAGVASQVNLPLTGNVIGDARITNDTGHLYVWSIEASSGLLTDWADAGDVVDIDWSVITNKPISSVVDIDDAVSKSHTSGSDNQIAETVPTKNSGETVQDKLDELEENLGDKVDKVIGSSLVPNTEISKIHTQNTDTKLITDESNPEEVEAIDIKDTVDKMTDFTNFYPFIAVESCEISIPPIDPLIGDKYAIPDGAEGDWQTHLGAIAIWNGNIWEYIEIPNYTNGLGLGIIYDKATESYKIYSYQNQWIPFNLLPSPANESVFHSAIEYIEEHQLNILIDWNRFIFMNSASPLNLIIPQWQDGFDVPLETHIIICQKGEGQVTVVAGDGVTIYDKNGLTTSKQWDIIHLINVGANIWITEKTIKNPLASDISTEDSGETVQDKLDTLETDSHTHSNKTELDEISSANRIVILKPIAETTDLVLTDGIMFFVIPEELNGMNLVAVGAHIFTVSSSGLPQIGIYNATLTQEMLETNITIDENEKDSKDATAPAVISESGNTVSTGDEIRIDIKAIGTGTKGLEVRLSFK